MVGHVGLELEDRSDRAIGILSSKGSQAPIILDGRERTVMGIEGGVDCSFVRGHGAP